MRSCARLGRARSARAPGRAPARRRPRGRARRAAAAGRPAAAQAPASRDRRVLVAAALDPTLMLEAMRAGVNECVAEPVSTTELEAAILRLLAHKHADRVRAGLRVRRRQGRRRRPRRSPSTSRPRSARRTPAQHAARRSAPVARRCGACSWAPSRVSRSSTRSRTPTASTRRSSRAWSCRRRPGPHLLASSDRRARRRRAASSGVRSLIEFATQLYRYVVLDVPRSDAAALDALDHADAHRRRRQPGAGDGPQRQPHGRGAPAAYGNERVRSSSAASISRPRSAATTSSGSSAARVLARCPERLPAGAAGAQQGPAARARQPQQAGGALPRAARAIWRASRPAPPASARGAAVCSAVLKGRR